MSSVVAPAIEVVFSGSVFWNGGFVAQHFVVFAFVDFVVVVRVDVFDDVSFAIHGKVVKVLTCTQTSLVYLRVLLENLDFDLWVCFWNWNLKLHSTTSKDVQQPGYKLYYISLHKVCSSILQLRESMILICCHLIIKLSLHEIGVLWLNSIRRRTMRKFRIWNCR